MRAPCHRQRPPSGGFVVFGDGLQSRAADQGVSVPAGKKTEENDVSAMKKHSFSSQPTTENPLETQTQDPVTRVLKVAQCPSISGRAEITYQVGCREGGTPYLRLCANSGKGAFSNEWVATADIAKAIADAQRVTAAGLSSALYPGKSANNGGFLLAVLMDLHLVEVAGDKVKSYVQKDAAAFVSEVRKLLDAGADLPLDARPVAVSPKPGKGVKRGKPASVPWITE